MDGWMDVVDKRETRDAAAKQEVQQHTLTHHTVFFTSDSVFILYSLYSMGSDLRLLTYDRMCPLPWHHLIEYIVLYVHPPRVHV